jgi:K+-sensing histidine kinase KdpD
MPLSLLLPAGAPRDDETAEIVGPAAPEGWESGYLWGTLAVSVCLALSGAVSKYLRLDDLVMINLLGVVAISTRFGIGPSLFTAALTSLGFDFFFIPPLYAFELTDMKNAVTFLIMFAVAGTISGLGVRMRRQQAATRARELQIETERLRSSLLSAVSHDLKTPLATIFGAGTELLRDGHRLGNSSRDHLARAIVEEAGRLNHLVTNLLEVTRLEAGTIELHKRAEAVEEVIESALGRVRGRLGERRVHTAVPEEVPMVPMDSVLVEQVLVNLLENAIRYSPDASPIDITVSQTNGSAAIELCDRGQGVRPAERDRLFEKFYRGTEHAKGDGGVGLGLTICRAIVQAHGGTIVIENRSGGGAKVRFTLPLPLEARSA